MVGLEGLLDQLHAEVLVRAHIGHAQAGGELARVDVVGSALEYVLQVPLLLRHLPAELLHDREASDRHQRVPLDVGVICLLGRIEQEFHHVSCIIAENPFRDLRGVAKHRERVQRVLLHLGRLPLGEAQHRLRRLLVVDHVLGGLSYAELREASGHSHQEALLFGFAAVDEVSYNLRGAHAVLLPARVDHTQLPQRHECRGLELRVLAPGPGGEAARAPVPDDHHAGGVIRQRELSDLLGREALLVCIVGGAQGLHQPREVILRHLDKRRALLRL
mmetsp:Transcript_54528/g.173265  ORF Transcript_54528/g.173265 Transcript_54528/m.173265 type:complete len:275 (+) Transcript_54528:647-1471(+)